MAGGLHFQAFFLFLIFSTFLLTLHFVREFTPGLSIEAKRAEKKAGKKKKAESTRNNQRCQEAARG